MIEKKQFLNKFNAEGFAELRGMPVEEKNSFEAETISEAQPHIILSKDGQVQENTFATWKPNL